MGLKIPKPVSSRVGEETMDNAEGASLLTPASPSTHLQNNIAPVLAKGPVQLCSCWAGEMIIFWGKEAGQELGGTARRHREFLPTTEEMLTARQTNLSSKGRWFPTATTGFWNRVKLLSPSYVSTDNQHRDKNPTSRKKNL